MVKKDALKQIFWGHSYSPGVKEEKLLRRWESVVGVSGGSSVLEENHAPVGGQVEALH